MLTEAYERDAGLALLLADPYFTDAFGAHTYHRTDKAGTFHTDWSGDHAEHDA